MSETVKIVKVYANRVWIESGFDGDEHVMIQSEAPGSEPVCVATARYHYIYNSNASRHRMAEDIAKSYGATHPIERRFREMPPALQPQPAP